MGVGVGGKRVQGEERGFKGGEGGWEREQGVAEQSLKTKLNNKTHTHKKKINGNKLRTFFLLFFVLFFLSLSFLEINNEARKVK